MPTKWGIFQAIGFEREISNGTRRVETALALILGDVTKGVPLVRIHSQCFTGEMLKSLRCDCSEQKRKRKQTAHRDPFLVLGYCGEPSMSSMR